MQEALDGPSAPTPAELEEALESGFASLMTLEADLQRAERRRVAEFDSAESGSPQELRASIESLREALARLRACTRTTPLALGFLLAPSGDA